MGGPLRYLVCVPQKFLSEKAISDPTSEYDGLFINSSSRWVLDIAEVSLKGLLISKAHLLPGDRYTGPIATGSVFLVTAFPKQHSNGIGSVRDPHNACNLVIRQASILDRHHKLSLLWIPAVSLSVSHSSSWQSSRKSGDSIDGKSSHFRFQALDAPFLEPATTIR